MAAMWWEKYPKAGALDAAEPPADEGKTDLELWRERYGPQAELPPARERYVGLPDATGVIDQVTGKVHTPDLTSPMRMPVGGMISGLGEVLEDLPGVETPLREAGQRIMAEAPSGIQKPIHLLTRFPRAAYEAAAQNIPQLGAAFTGAATGGAVGRRLAGPAGEKVGQQVGGLAPIFAQEYSEIREGQRETGQENVPKALAGAAVATFLERFGPERLAIGAASKAGRANILKTFFADGSWPARVARVLGVGGTEAATEVGQGFVERLAAGKPVADHAAVDSSIIEAAMGFLGGTTAATAFEGADALLRRTPPATPPPAPPPAPSEPLALPPPPPPAPFVVTPEGAAARPQEFVEDAARKAELGLTPDVETAQRVLARRPALTPTAADNIAARRRAAGEDVVVVPHPRAPGKFVVATSREAEVFDAATRTPAPPVETHAERVQPDAPRGYGPRDRANELKRLATATADAGVKNDLLRQAELLEAEAKGKPKKMTAAERNRRLRTPDPMKDDLITYLRKKGGLNVSGEKYGEQHGAPTKDWAGRLQHLDKNTRIIGLPGIEQGGEKGMTLDEAAEVAFEAGFIRDNDWRQLQELLFESESGKKVLAMGIQHDKAELEAQERMRQDIERRQMERELDAAPYEDFERLRAQSALTTEEIEALGADRDPDDVYADMLADEDRTIVVLAERARQVAPDAVEAIPDNYTDAQVLAELRRILSETDDARPETDPPAATQGPAPAPQLGVPEAPVEGAAPEAQLARGIDPGAIAGDEVRRIFGAPSLPPPLRGTIEGDQPVTVRFAGAADFTGVYNTPRYNVTIEVTGDAEGGVPYYRSYSAFVDAPLDTPDKRLALIRSTVPRFAVSDAATTTRAVPPSPAAAIDAAASDAATSTDNDRPEPTEAQKEAGNYKKGHVSLHGLDISIENPKGSRRRPEWPELTAHYGYIKGTRGRDKEHIDVFIGPNPESDRVYVVDQVRPESGAFDEHKVMLGYDSLEAARTGYLSNYAKGWKGLGEITEVDLDDFKGWLSSGTTTRPFADMTDDERVETQRDAAERENEREAEAGTGIFAAQGHDDQVAKTRHELDAGDVDKVERWLRTEAVSPDVVREAIDQAIESTPQPGFVASLLRGVEERLREAEKNSLDDTFRDRALRQGWGELKKNAKPADVERWTTHQARLKEITDWGRAASDRLYAREKDLTIRLLADKGIAIGDTVQFTGTLWDGHFGREIGGPDDPVVSELYEAGIGLQMSGPRGDIIAIAQQDVPFVEKADGEAQATPEETDVAPEDRGASANDLREISETFAEAQREAVSDEDSPTRIFDPPAKSEIVRLQDKVRVRVGQSGWMTPEEAKAEIQKWKDNAAAQGEGEDSHSVNAQKVVISLFDYTGQWALPWEEAGYNVFTFDLQDESTYEDPETGEEKKVGDVNNMSVSFFNDLFGSFDGMDVHAVLAACPCTDFAVSGARHFAAKDADGRTVESVRLVHQTLAVIEYFKPAVWAIENPVGRIEKLGGLPPWRLSFDPNHVGHPYTKKTLLWGRFNADLPIAPVEPVEGSKMHQKYGGKSLRTKNARSETPEGFAYAFFQANNAVDHPLLAVAGKYDRLDREALRGALEAGLTPKQIDHLVEDFYYQELDDAAANESLRRAARAEIVGIKKSHEQHRAAMHRPAGDDLFGDPERDADAREIDDGLDQEGGVVEDDDSAQDEPTELPGEATGEEADDERVEPEQLDRASPGPLAGAPAAAVPPAQGEREAGKRPAGSRREDDGGTDLFGGPGPAALGGLGDGPGAVSVRAGGEAGRSVSTGGTGYVITDADRLGSGGLKAKYNDNVAAIRVLKQLEAERRHATHDEQKTLVRYVGWGGIPQAFNANNREWAEQYAELKALLTDEEYRAARASTQNAHYTSVPVVRAVYDALARFGFTGGRVLEPAVGTGNFIGLMPGTMRGQSSITAVELDDLTGRMTRALYPTVDLRSPQGFQDVRLPDGSFDVVIGNPPFGNEQIFDAERKAISRFSIHNYFFAKSVDLLRPGGVLAMVVSNYLMDKPGTAQRDYISERAKLLGAIRLPNTAFKQNANTEVTTDIIFLQRLPEGATDRGEAWDAVRSIPDPDGGAPIEINEYFARHSEMMLGTMRRAGSMYRKGEPALVPNEGESLPASLTAAVQRLPQDVFTPAAAVLIPEDAQAAADTLVPSEIRAGNYFVRDGQLYQAVEAGTFDKDGNAVLGEEPVDPEALGTTGMVRVRALVELRDLARQQLRLELADRAPMFLSTNRRKLNDAYDRFVKRHGPINALANKRLMRADVDWPLLAALEVGYDPGISKTVAAKTGETPRKASAKKADIFSRRVVEPVRAAEKADSAVDALSLSLSEKGRVDLEYMGRLTGQAPEALRTELAGRVFRVPGTDDYVTADDYLSGNVKRKLAEARAAAQHDPSLADNVRALEAVQPPDVDPVDISVPLGAPWLPSDVVADFARHLLGEGTEANIIHAGGGIWSVKIQAGSSALNTEEWGTPRYPATRVLDALSNSRPIKVYDEHADGSRSLNQPETDNALRKAEAVKRAFAEWVWEDDARRTRLARIYNDGYNTDVLREYDGSHLQLPGKVPDALIRLNPHQKNAIWRIVSSGKGLLDHVVGAGKTFVMIAAGMELRRLGRMRKPLYVVPNHLVGQWAASFQQLYPGARVLAPTKADFEKGRRKELFSRIATGDWDAVIVAHSSFLRIPVSKDLESEFYNEQISDLETSLRALKGEGGDGRHIKRLEKSVAKLKEKVKALLDEDRRDDTLTFDEIGVDGLFVDEAHEFKNLAYSTGQRVSGLGDPSGSKKAMDLFVKSRQIQKRHGGRNVVFATATPISNTMSEMYTMLRYLHYDALAERGIAHFDAWAKVFGEIKSEWAVTPTGIGYRLESRFAEFVNMPELMTMYRSFSDVVPLKRIQDGLQAEGKRFPIPKIAGGKPEMVIIERNDELKRYMEGIVKRAEALKGKRPEPGADNILVVMNDAANAAVDLRLMIPEAEDYAGSKLNVTARNVAEIYRLWQADRGTQLVFLDRGTPKASRGRTLDEIKELLAKIEAGDEAAQDQLEKYSPAEILDARSDSSFSAYDELKRKLVAQGVPDAEIAFIHDANTDAQKEELFGRVRSGRVRVLIGSTSKMGAGMNVQERLVALHHLDAPWRPSDLEQREGRILRQGNALYERDPDGFEVRVLRYGTELTLDSRRWQVIENKAKFIEQVRNGSTGRRAKDVAPESMNAAEMKAAVSGNPLIAEEIQLRQEVEQLEAAQSEHNRARHRARSKLAAAESEAARIEASIGNVERDARTIREHPAKPFAMQVGGRTFAGDAAGADGATPRSLAGSALVGAIAKAVGTHRAGEEGRIGEYRGLPVFVSYSEVWQNKHIHIRARGEHEPGFSIDLPLDQVKPAGIVTRIENLFEAIEARPQQLRTRATEARSEAEKLRARTDSRFEGASELEDKRRRHAEVIGQLTAEDKKPQPGEDGPPDVREPEPAPYSQRKRTIPWPESAQLLSSMVSTERLKAHPDYAAAKAGDVDAAHRVVHDTVGPEQIAEARRRFRRGTIFLPVGAHEQAGRNALPHALAARYAHAVGGRTTADVVQANRTFHTGAEAIARLVSRPRFAGDVEAGQRYVLVDDVATLGATLAELAQYIHDGGAQVVGAVVIADKTRGGGMMHPSVERVRALKELHGHAIEELFDILPEALTGAEASYLSSFKSLDSLRDRAVEGRRQVEARARERALPPEVRDPGPVDDESAQVPGEGARSAPPRPRRARVRRDVQPTAFVSRDDVQGEFATRTQLIATATREIGTGVVRTPNDAAQAFNYVGRFADERFDALVTDDTGKPLAIVGAFKGTIDGASVYPEAVLKEAVRIPGAARIWFAHNHPSGKAEFSAADRMLHAKLIEIFRGSQIQTMGHILLGMRAGQQVATYENNNGSLEFANQPVEPPKRTMQVPVVERELVQRDKLGMHMSEPRVVRENIQALSKGKSGALLLDTQHFPVAYLPIAPNEAVPLRGTGRMDALVRALSVANGATVILYNNGDYTPRQAANLGRFFRSMSVRVLDLFSLEDGELFSYAERGRDDWSGHFESRAAKPGRGITMDAAQQAADAITDQLPSVRRVLVYQNPSQLPPEKQAGLSDYTEGAFIDGRVYLFTDALDSVERARWVVLHEIVGHLGLRGALGQQLDTALTAARTNAIVRRLADAIASDRGWGDSETDRLNATEEALAELAAALETGNFAELQTRYGVGVPPMFQKGVRGAVERFMQAVRKALRKLLGADQAQMTDEEVMGLIRASRAYLSGDAVALDEQLRDAMASQAPAIYYSQMTRTIEGKLPNSGQATELASVVEAYQRKGMFKAEELEWSGLLDWLRGQQGRVTKDQVLEFLRANEVRVEEVVRAAGNADADPVFAEIRHLTGALSARGYHAQFDPDLNGDPTNLASLTKGRDTFYPGDALEGGRSFEELPEDDRAMAERLSELSAEAQGRTEPPADTTFEEYTLPGATAGTYRELLLTLPLAKVPGLRGIVHFKSESAVDEFMADLSIEGMERLDYGAITGKRGERLSVEFEQLNAGDLAKFQEIARRHNGRVESQTEGTAPAFRTAHFDAPNIVAHIRFTERVDADGKRVLFIEEIQSDWHQQGRRTGYKSARPEDRTALPPKTKWHEFTNSAGTFFQVVHDPGPGGVSSSYRTRQEAVDDAWRSVESQMVPDAPFKTTWPMLAMKRAIRWAVDHGYDRVAWTTGEQQAARYDLSRRVTSITAERRTAAGTLFRVVLHPKGAGHAVHFKVVNGVVQEAPPHLQDKPLAEVVGKEMAAKIMAVDHFEQFTGLDLVVGGEGMRAFYDRELVNETNKYVKKWGARVGETKIPVDERLSARGMTEGDADRIYGRQTPTPTSVHAFDVTEDMRRAARYSQPMFSVSRHAYAAREFIADAFDSKRTFNRWWHRTVGTQYHKAQIDADFRRVFEAGQRYLQDVSLYANSAAEQAPDILPRMNGLLDALKTGAPQGDVDAVAEAVFHGTLVDNAVYTDAQLRERFRLNDAQVRLYRQFRAAIDRSLDDLALSDFVRSARKLGVDGAIAQALEAGDFDTATGTLTTALRDAAAALTRASQEALEAEDRKNAKALGDRAVTMEETADLIAEKAERIRVLKAQGYAPLMRFGQYTVYVTGAEGEQIYFGLFESQRQANAMAREMREQYPDAQVTEGVLSQDSYQMFRGITPETLELFADVAGISGNELFQQYLQHAVSSRSALKRLIERKGTPGFDKDLSRTLATFVTSNGRAASANLHMGEMSEAVQAIPKEKGDVRDEAVRLYKYLTDPQDELPGFRSFLFFNFLGGSVASALVNMTQPVTMTFPYLARFGAASAGSALRGAFAPTISGKTGDADLQQALEHAQREGVVSPHEIYQLYGEAMRSYNVAGGRQASRVMHAFLRGWGALFAAAEQFNRRLTFIAAYRMAREMGDHLSARTGARTPTEFAIKAVQETQGIYNKGNRPDWARGPIGATIFTFKQFSIAYMEFLVRLPPEQKALALAVILVAAGVQGLPFSDDLDDLIDTIAQSLGYNFSTRQAKRDFLTRVLGEAGADFVLEGVSALPGVPLDVQGRLSFGNLIPGTRLFLQARAGKEREALDVLGPAGGIAQNVAEGIRHLQRGDPAQVAKAVTPVAIQNLLQGMDMLTHGMYRDRDGRKVLDTNAYEAFIKMVGFHPRSVARQSRRMSESRQRINFAREQEDAIADRIASGLLEGDREQVAAGLAGLLDWNRKNPTTPIAIDSGQIQSRVRNMILTREQRFLKTAPPEMRGTTAQELQ